MTLQPSADERPTVPWDSEWTELVDFPGYYFSQYGQLFRMKTGAVIAEHKLRGTDKPYLQLLMRNGKKRSVQKDFLVRTVLDRLKERND